MRKSRFKEEQIIAILKEGDAGVPPEELCRRHGITRGSLYRWKAKYGGMESGDAPTSTQGCSAMNLQRTVRMASLSSAISTRLRMYASGGSRLGSKTM